VDDIKSEASDGYEIQSNTAFPVAAVRKLGSGPEHNARQHIAFRPGSISHPEPIRNKSSDINSTDSTSDINSPNINSKHN
jgi:hypothetical protein